MTVVNLEANTNKKAEIRLFRRRRMFAAFGLPWPRNPGATLAVCQQAGCSHWRRIWRHLCWRNSRIRLQEAWYCAPQCFELALRRNLEQAVIPATRFGARALNDDPDPQWRARTRSVVSASIESAPNHRIPLGLLLLSRGQLNNAQLRIALARQQSEGGRLGKCLERLGFTDESQITAALAVQWSCPVWPATEAPVLECARMLPLTLLRAFNIYPLRFVAATRTFYLAFSDRLDHSVLYAIAQMLQCRTEPCVMRQSVLCDFLAGIERLSDCADMLFERPEGYEEIARITSAYVLKLGAQQVRIANCRNYLWARLITGRDVANLLFHFPLDGGHGGLDKSTYNRQAC